MNEVHRNHWPVVGHAGAVNQLQRAIDEDRLGQAYLITGPAQIGKAALARALAMALNCTGATRPCGACRACVRIASNTHADVRFIAPEGERLKIEQIRELQRELSLAPLEARLRVAILDDFDRATVEAMNALLKTLEEPPSRVVLILIAPEAEVLLPTIVSRCQIIALRPLTPAQVQTALSARWGIDGEHAALLAHLSGGRLGWAVTAAQDDALLEKRAARLNELQRLLSASRVERFAYAEALARRPADAREALDLWRTWWRDVLLVAAASSAELTNIDRRGEIEALATRLTAQHARAAAEACSRALWQLDKNAVPRLVLEVMLLNLPNI
ncbi:MAG TPA: DNA polymerase III subunit delta' [Anaerolineae bacterium]|nr:DNA polymerase III subunit delta' [Anaerolineae bacterium]